MPCISPDFTTCKQNSAAVPSTVFPTVVAPNLPVSHSPLGVAGFTIHGIQAMNVDQQSISTSDLLIADRGEHATSSSNFVAGNQNTTGAHEERCDDSEELLDPPESMEYS